MNATQLSPVGDTGRLVALHTKVLKGDVSAREDVTEYLLEHVRRIVRRRMPRLDVAMLDDAIEDAVLHYLAHPDLYDPARARLDTLITLAATHNVLNSIRGEQRRRRTQELAAKAQPTTSESSESTLPPSHMTVAALICLANTEEERRLLAVRFGGERRTTKLAAILNLTHLPIAEQRKQVKRATDRLMLRVRRHVRARCPRR